MQQVYSRLGCGNHLQLQGYLQCRALREITLGKEHVPYRLS